jgi:DNA-binding transcriptional regulator YiaG
VTDLQKEVHTLRKAELTIPAEPKQEQSIFWITGKVIKAVRKRLGITQIQLAKLAGVSNQAVVNWEQKEGRWYFASKKPP